MLVVVAVSLCQHVGSLDYCQAAFRYDISTVLSGFRFSDPMTAPPPPTPPLIFAKIKQTVCDVT